jgi:hypothetical protein
MGYVGKALLRAGDWPRSPSRAGKVDLGRLAVLFVLAILIDFAAFIAPALRERHAFELASL